MKHTPGPWKAVIYEGAYDQPLITSGYGNIGRLHSHDKRQHEANATLIAAAPELLEILGELMYKMNEHQENGFTLCANNGMTDLANKALRVYTKATGQL